MNKEDLIWFAGIFEGEGTTGLWKSKRKSGKWKICSYFLICNNDPAIIMRIKQIAKDFDINLTIHSRNKDTKEDWNVNYQILTKRMSHTHKLLSKIRPYLVGTKRYIADLTMEFIESRDYGRKRGTWGEYTDKDFELVKECKKYNQQGKDKKMLKSSETIRQALERGDDIVRASMRVGEWEKSK